jgi:hypothetical protein
VANSEAFVFILDASLVDFQIYSLVFEDFEQSEFLMCREFEAERKRKLRIDYFLKIDGNYGKL